MIFNINSTRVQTRFLTCVARVTCLVIIKSLFQAMPIKVRCTIAQKSAQIVGARVHICIITKLRKHTGVTKKRSTYININILKNDYIWHISV